MKFYFPSKSYTTFVGFKHNIIYNKYIYAYWYTGVHIHANINKCKDAYIHICILAYKHTPVQRSIHDPNNPQDGAP